MPEIRNLASVAEHLHVVDAYGNRGLSGRELTPRSEPFIEIERLRSEVGRVTGLERYRIVFPGLTPCFEFAVNFSAQRIPFRAIEPVGTV